MARTVDQEAHAARRGEFLDAAQRLIQTRGYERMSIRDVADEVGASRAAVFHYFDSKHALLEGLVERTADALHAHLVPYAVDPDRPAPEKLQRLFDALAGWKAAERRTLRAMLEVWYSDDNAIAREKTRRMATARVAPLLARIARQGIEEGTFATPDPEEAGRIAVALIHHLDDDLASLFLGSDPSGPARAARTIAAHTRAVEHALAARPGSLRLTDAAAVTAWFER